MILFCQSPFSVSTHIFSPYYYLVHILLEVVSSGASLSLGDCLYQQMAGHSETTLESGVGPLLGYTLSV